MLLGLSANSPYWRGDATGLASTRMPLFRAFPRVGIPPYYEDRQEYAASVPKIGILLAYFHLHPGAATNLDAQTRHELGLMVKASSNEMATRFSRELGLRQIQDVLNAYQFYDPKQGGGIWVGKHYGQGSERIGDPLDDHYHAATVRQLLRYFLRLEQGTLVSPAASRESSRPAAVLRPPPKTSPGNGTGSTRLSSSVTTWPTPKASTPTTACG
mgnify:CR=1 FL=1